MQYVNVNVNSSYVKIVEHRFRVTEKIKAYTKEVRYRYKKITNVEIKFIDSIFDSLQYSSENLSKLLNDIDEKLREDVTDFFEKNEWYIGCYESICKNRINYGVKLLDYIEDRIEEMKWRHSKLIFTEEIKTIIESITIDRIYCIFYCLRTQFFENHDYKENAILKGRFRNLYSMYVME